MREERALQDAPPCPAWIASIRRIVRLPSRAARAVCERVALFRFEPEGEPDPQLADLWLMLLATDPEGTWHAWPGASRRHQIDDTTHT
jgi:hypothetical protein